MFRNILIFNRKMFMEDKNIFIEFLLNKANVINNIETYENTLFIDGDIILLNKLRFTNR